MYTIIFATIIIGLLMSFFGFKGLLRQLNFRKNSKKIIISKEKNMLLFEEIGIYAISISSSSFFSPSELNIKLEDVNNATVSLVRNVFQYKFFYSWECWEESYVFDIQKKGNYVISLPSNSNTSVEVLISKTRKNFDKITTIVLSVFGFNILSWGILLACNPDVIKKFFP